MHANQTHPEVVKRLRRVGGHVASIVDMIDQGRPCLDVAQQLLAVEKAVEEARKTLIQDHLDHCLEDVAGPLAHEQRAAINSLKEISRYL